MPRLAIDAAIILSPRNYGRIPSTSTEQIRVRVEGPGVEEKRPVWVALTPHPGVPALKEWRRARWDLEDPSGMVAELLTGPQSPVKTSPGEHWVWVRVDAAPASVHRRAGFLVIT